MSKLLFTIITFSMLFISCKSVPPVKAEPIIEAPGKTPVQAENEVIVQTEPEKKAETTLETAPDPVIDELDEIIAEFNGVTITKRDKEIAMAEIEEVVKKLNEVTFQKDYPRWLTFLSDNYREEFSKPSVLKRTSENLPGAGKGIRLKDLKDYFTYVFVPSRQRGRVDDIAYLTPTKVRVLKKDKNKELIFYNLENIKGKWKLVP